MKHPSPQFAKYFKVPPPDVLAEGDLHCYRYGDNHRLHPDLPHNLRHCT